MAKIDLQNTNLTIVGHWNVAIITPPWIQTQFPEFKVTEDIPLEIGINIRDIRFTIKDLVINPSPNRLIISPKVETNECFESLILLMSGIIEKLNHTPMIAVGSNFAYVLDKSEEIVPIQGDAERLDEYYSKIGKKFSGNFVSQHVLVENDMEITVFYNLSPSARIVTFNYNINTNRLSHIVEFIKDFPKQKNDSFELLKNLLGK